MVSDYEDQLRRELEEVRRWANRLEPIAEAFLRGESRLHNITLGAVGVAHAFFEELHRVNRQALTEVSGSEREIRQEMDRLLTDIFDTLQRLVRQKKP